LVVYPVSQDSLINIVACTTDLSKEGTVFEGSSTTISTRELLCVFEGWEEEVQALLRVSHNYLAKFQFKSTCTLSQCIKQPTKWAIPTVITLDRYASGRVILAGDAVRAFFSVSNFFLV
jgi:salicylate hydroxylase